MYQIYNNKINYKILNSHSVHILRIFAKLLNELCLIVCRKTCRIYSWVWIVCKAYRNIKPLLFRGLCLTVSYIILHYNKQKKIYLYLLINVILLNVP